MIKDAWTVWSSFPGSNSSRREACPADAPAGFQVIGEIRAPGFLEGGDFFPAGRDLALVGVGLRSNFEACQQLMDEDLLGVRRLAVVRDENEMHQVRAAVMVSTWAELSLLAAPGARHHRPAGHSMPTSTLDSGGVPASTQSAQPKRLPTWSIPVPCPRIRLQCMWLLLVAALQHASDLVCVAEALGL